MQRPILRTTLGALLSASLILPQAAMAFPVVPGRQMQADTGAPLILAQATNQSNVQQSSCEDGAVLPCFARDGTYIKSEDELRAFLDAQKPERSQNRPAKRDEQQAGGQGNGNAKGNGNGRNRQAGGGQNQGNGGTQQPGSNTQQPASNTQTATPAVRDCVRGVELPCVTQDGKTINTVKGLREHLGLPPLDRAGNETPTPQQGNNDQAVTTSNDRPAADPQRAARREARAAAEARARNEAAAGRDGSGRVTRERVTRENTRRSDQEYESSSSSSDKKEPLLTDFQKVLALGLGALAVGAILRNGDRVEANSGDRVVVSRDGELTVLKDDDALLRRPGSEISTETFDDGSTRTTVVNADGSMTVTIRAADGRVLRRAKVLPDGRQVLLFDDLQDSAPVQLSLLPTSQRPNALADGTNSEAELQRALESALYRDTGRRYSLWQVREIRAVRELAPEVELSAITFASGSAAIPPAQAQELIALGQAMADIIAARPQEVFLIEGHTDATGSEALNLALSDRRAETVALALTEYFDVPPENLITQGYGETALKIPTEAAEARNRRAVVRRITPLLNGTNS